MTEVIGEVAKRVRIRELNDPLRTTFPGGGVVCSAGVAVMPEAPRFKPCALSTGLMATPIRTASRILGKSFPVTGVYFSKSTTTIATWPVAPLTRPAQRLPRAF